MNAAVDRLRDALKAHGCEPNDKGEARCPAHDDARASLSFGKGDKGAVVHCHADCSTAAIVDALGLKMAELFDDYGEKPREVAAYDYTDETGKLLFQVVRFEPKNFRQRRPGEGGEWIWKLEDTRRVLYRLPAVLEAVKAGRTIYVVEGEKDVATLVGWGLDATCNPGGAGKGKWRPEYSKALRGARVVIIADGDKPGREHAAHVNLALAGVADEARVVELPGAKDATAWAQAGGTREALEALLVAPARSDGPPVALEFLRTDGGNAEVFVRDHRGKVRYCFPWSKWLAWDGVRWATNDNGAVEGMVKETVRGMIVSATELPDDDENRKKALNWAVQSDSKTRREAMLSLARSEPGIPVLQTELDAQPYLLNVGNGVIDLRDGSLLPHDPTLLLTRLAPVDYDPEASAPTWVEFLERVLPAVEMRLFLQRFLGYCLTAYVSEQVLVFMFGAGANGKTTLVNAVMWVLGSYARQAAPDLLVQSGGDHHPTELADLFGARFVPTVEVQEGKRLAEVLVKQLTGGDRIKARFMRQDFWEFDPTHKLVLVANHKPIVRGTDYAIWRRILMVPFDVTIPAEERDSKLPEKLRAEAPGILRWLVEGCTEWVQNGLRPPAAVQAATESYKAEMDTIKDWIEDRCLVRFDLMTASGELYADYVKWCENAGERPLRRVLFGSKLEEKGFVSLRGSKGKRRWSGIGLLTMSGGMGGVTDSDLPITDSSYEPRVNKQEITPPAPLTPLTPKKDREPGSDDDLPS